MDEFRQAEHAETANEIMQIALNLSKINRAYYNIPFKDQVNIAIKILELYEQREIKIALIEIDNSIVDAPFINKNL